MTNTLDALAARPYYEDAPKVFSDLDDHYWTSYNSYVAWCRACTTKTKPDKTEFDRDYCDGKVRIAESRDPALSQPMVDDIVEHNALLRNMRDKLSLSETLAERKTQHGDFTDHAHAAQDLKGVLWWHQERRNERRQPALSMTQQEALEMILHKIARIVAGDANHLDHWHDIAGYATITAERIK